MSRGTRELLPGRSESFNLRDYHPLRLSFPGAFSYDLIFNFPGYTLKQPHNPDGISSSGLGSSPFARHYLGNLYLISLPGGTEMFHFPPFASAIYVFNG